ncbi:hypothetical protein UFOVP410_67 [uncultured Caudovirales phage]|uniref:Uncharacterized protein n=1 Tax=uncultured Caudovirales phage TaxID=2100421 RepID=A0A6J5M3P2_9CAUD|nr:hypothetical protein UFOVP410_67 [uncultured Caudovirales phage]
MTENVETAETVESVEMNVTDNVSLTETLSPEQEINALRSVHKYLSEFDRVPGSMSATWSQMLDTVAVVANSLIAKATKSLENTELEVSSDKSTN